MTRTAQELLDAVTTRLAPDPAANPLVPLFADGTANGSAITALALEQRSVIPADRRSFLHLAERSAATGKPSARPSSAPSPKGRRSPSTGSALSSRRAAWARRTPTRTSRARAARPIRRTWPGSP
ncbi:hypothetical protein ACFQ0X_37230 [Streptomyces rectiviolaceus]|uniref:hypothetical protein n=1 Tax=Streptomyces rectiviolaceus TaxID=332591 RepID=UPI003634A8F7